MFYPINLDIKGRKCIVVGGGRVALRKVRGLLDCGASVTVISPILHDDLHSLHSSGDIAWLEKKYSQNDISGAFLVIAATNDQQAQESVFQDAERLSVLLNVADVPDKCNFILPARVKRGSLSIAVSTGGKSPALAKMLRKKFEQEFDEKYTTLNDIMGILRPEVLQYNLTQRENEHIFTVILASKILDLIADKDIQKTIALLEQSCGKPISEATCKAIKQRLC